ncbi:MAG TPA: oligogalacturonate lyase family protein, partial [Phycisphaerae bacterium]|nr:oligogalacturonate lyase family protein [Phycisphaerae bacterium]
MTRSFVFAALTLACITATAFAQAGGRAGAAAAPDVSTMRTDWIDPDTGHHVYRLSTENGSGNLYFHYNAYSADGRKVVFNSPAGIMAADLASKKAELIVPGVRAALETARKSNEVFYLQGNAIMAADLDTKKTRQVVAIPDGLKVACVNCDGSLFAGIIENIPDPDGNDKAAKPDKIASEDQLSVMFAGKDPATLTEENKLSATKENNLAQRLNAVLKNPNPRCLFTLNAKTGEVKKFGYAYAWLNHLQFSPTDPNMLMFCHEGTWHETIRVWTINTAAEKPVAVAMHQRSMPMEIWGHEWWAPDGKSVGFDLQKPRSGNFFIAKVPLQMNGASPAPGAEIDFPLDKNWWGIHFAMSKDGSMYASDGGDPGQVSFAPDGMWINLLRVTKPSGGEGSLSREKLVNMKNHDYVTNQSVQGRSGVEPNVTFSPDDKYIIFGGTFD